jgi:predicted secreted Zn-dependent protease
VNHASESARILRHEQTHFDITEVYARRIRRHLSTMTGPCGRGESELQSITRRLVSEEKQAQQRYDRETNHGLIATRQAEWNANVANMLRAVERYALP